MNKALPILLALAYPLLLHASVIYADSRLAFAALACLSAVALYVPLAQRRAWAWLLLGAVLAALGLLQSSGHGAVASYLPSLAIPAALGLLFGSSPRPGREALITGIARFARKAQMPAELERYTRRLTLVWTGMFALMFTVALLLIVLQQWRLWSLVTNFISYLLVGALFFVEYWYRRWRFPQHEHGGFIEHIRTVATARRHGH